MGDKADHLPVLSTKIQACGQGAFPLAATTSIHSRLMELRMRDALQSKRIQVQRLSRE